MSSKYSVLISRLVNAELLSELLLSESEGAAYSPCAPVTARTVATLPRPLQHFELQATTVVVL